ncbi:MAG TPA: hypothetical protein VIJ47_01860 [Acidimicrobiales bacterium]
MADALFILIVVAFFGLMVLLVKACDHIIGPDELVSSDVAEVESDAPPDEAAPDPTAGSAEVVR